MQIKWWHISSFLLLLAPTVTLWFVFIKALCNDKYETIIAINWYYEAWPEFIGLTLILIFGIAALISVIKGKDKDDDTDSLRKLLEE